MNPKLLTLISLRSLSLLMTLQGQTRAADALNLLAAGIEAELDVDAHMQAIADALKAGVTADWDGVADRIEADSARLQAP